MTFHLAGRRKFSAAHKAYERGLTSSIATQNSYALANSDRQIDVAQDVHRPSARWIEFVHTGEADHSGTTMRPTLRVCAKPKTVNMILIVAI